MTAAHHPAGQTGPFADSVTAYWAAGWRGTLPLPPNAKTYPPKGWTGGAGQWPSWPDVHTWVTSHNASGNLALRLPDDVIGIDVDDYGDKQGARRLTELEAQWGALPRTWSSSSRGDHVNGIRLFRVPPGLWWPGELGDGIDIIQVGHRYIVAPPSIHPEGGTYRWTTPDGLIALPDVVPTVEELPDLPDTWIQGVTQGRTAKAKERAGLNDAQAETWLTERGQGSPCPTITRRLERALSDLRDGTKNRHGAARDATMRIVTHAGEGHRGASDALHALREAWEPILAGSRTPQGADGEWNRLVIGAIDVAAKEHPDPVRDDPCDWPTLVVPPFSDPAPPVFFEDGAGPETPERTSWWPRGLVDVPDEPPPVCLTRTDGTSLFYAGKVNGLLGESESGKTWLALDGVVQELKAGRPVVYLDFEDSPAGMRNRLQALGATPEDLQLLQYVNPDEALHAVARDDLTELLVATRPSLIVVDGVNAAMTLLGYKLTDNAETVMFDRVLLRPLAKTGAVVLTVDHLPKNAADTKGGIGAQAKRAMVSGCAVKVEVLTEFGRGRAGKLKLTVDKDRPGHVRAVAAGAKNLGVAVLTSDAETGAVTLRLEPPEGVVERAPGAPFRPTVLMEKVSRFISANPEPVSAREVRAGVTGKVTAVLEALDRLVEEGFVSREKLARRGGPALVHSHLKPYFRSQDPMENPLPSVDNPSVSEVVPSGSQVVPSGSREPLPGVATEVVPSGSQTPPTGGRGTRNHFRPPDPAGTGSPPKWFPPTQDTRRLDDGTLVDTATGEVLDD